MSFWHCCRGLSVSLVALWGLRGSLVGFPGGSDGKESAYIVGSIPGLGRSAGEGKGYPPQYSSLENSMDCVVVHGVGKSRTPLSDFCFHLVVFWGPREQAESEIGLISLLSKVLSRVFSSTTVWKHQFFGTQPSLWSNSMDIHIPTLWMVLNYCLLLGVKKRGARNVKGLFYSLCSPSY